MKIYNKKLYKSRKNRIFAGVMGGLGEYFNIDPVLFRIIFIGLSLYLRMIFPAILFYILIAIIMQKRPSMIHEESHT